MLSAEMEVTLLLEQFEDNSFLPKFYKEPSRYAFPLEMSFLASRFNQLKGKLNNYSLFGDGVIADYCLFKSLVFAKINLEDDEYHLFLKMFEIIDAQIPKPELIVYLHRPVTKLIQHIVKRGRSYEQDIPPDYLEQIHEGYMSYLKGLKHQKVLVLEIDAMDFQHKPEDYIHLKKLLFEPREEGIQHYRL